MTSSISSRVRIACRLIDIPGTQEGSHIGRWRTTDMIYSGSELEYCKKLLTRRTKIYYTSTSFCYLCYLGADFLELLKQRVTSRSHFMSVYYLNNEARCHSGERSGRC